MHSFAWWPTIVRIAVLGVLSVATFTDLRSRRIPNWLVLPFLLAGIVVSPWRHDWPGIRQGFWHGLGQSFAGLGLGILIYGLLFWMGGMGPAIEAGAAVGAWLGPAQLFFALFFAALIGGIMVLGWAAFGGFLKDLFIRARAIFSSAGSSVEYFAIPNWSSPILLKRKMPYAPAIAVGTLMSFFAR